MTLAIYILEIDYTEKTKLIYLKIAKNSIYLLNLFK